MLLKDFILNATLRWTNQRLPSLLSWTTGITSYVNFALNDIYTFEWRYRTFMHDKIELDCTTDFPDWEEVVYIDVPYPLLRVMYIEDLSNTTESFDCLNIEPTDKINYGDIYYKQHTKRIYLRNNKNRYIIHYIHYFDMVQYADDTEIPIPDLFLWALYELVMWYIYPNYWQQGENKEANAFNKWRQALVDLAKTDSMQINWISWSNIH